MIFARRLTQSRPVAAALGIALLTLLTGCTASRSVTADARAVTVDRVAFQGWPDALRMRNAEVETIIVPDIGRIMSFRFRDGVNIFWTDPALAGQRGDASGQQWVNFGGDKTWPAPEAEWKTYTKQAQWMPPPAFDALPVTASVEGETVVLTSPVDPFYGVRTVRRVSLRRGEPAMKIETTYERVSGEPSKIGIWVITQFVEPVAVYILPPASSQFARGYFTFRETLWPQLTVADDGLIRVTRDPQANHKLGSDADRMLWVGEDAMCLVASPRISNAEYPDRGASAEVYTNSDPKKYVELETLGPLSVMKPGDSIRQVNTYTLLRRAAGADADVEARRVLAKK